MKQNMTIVANDVQCHYKDNRLKFLRRHKAYLIFVNLGGTAALFNPEKLKELQKCINSQKDSPKWQKFCVLCAKKRALA